MLTFPRPGTTNLQRGLSLGTYLRSGARLVVASHRVPASPRLASQGGLAAMLRSALSQSMRVLWFGWSGRFAGDTRARARVAMSSHQNLTLAAVDLTAAQCEGYLDGFANGTIWPLFHGSAEQAGFKADHLSLYRAVNWHFAVRLAPLLHADDRVWIQDYHLLPLGGMLRRAGVRAPVGLFLHIPFPSADALMAAPWHGSLAADLAAYDLIGFQTSRDERNFAEFMLRTRDAATVAARSSSSSGLPTTGVFPVGIDTREFMASMTSAEAIDCRTKFARSLPHRPLIVSAERLDHTKGLLERLRAYEQLLDRHPAHREKACLVQITTPSRAGQASHVELHVRQQTVTEQINARFMTAAWKPIYDIYAPMHPMALAALYRISRVGLFVPLSDGMGLGAKEYIAAQDPQDPGALVLSRFAGAAEQLTEALIVDPTDTDAVAAALEAALAMPLLERQARWRAMIVKLMHHDATAWCQSFLYARSHAHRTLALRPTQQVGLDRNADCVPAVMEGSETAGVAMS